MWKWVPARTRRPMRSKAALSPRAPCSFEKHFQARGKRPKKESCTYQRTTPGHSSSIFITSTTMSSLATHQRTNTARKSLVPLRDYTCYAKSCRIRCRRTASSRRCPIASTQFVPTVLGTFRGFQSSKPCTKGQSKVPRYLECSLTYSLKVFRQSSRHPDWINKYPKEFIQDLAACLMTTFDLDVRRAVPSPREGKVVAYLEKEEQVEQSQVWISLSWMQMIRST